MHLIDGGKALERKSIRDTHKGRPDPPVEAGVLGKPVGSHTQHKTDTFHVILRDSEQSPSNRAA